MRDRGGRNRERKPQRKPQRKRGMVGERKIGIERERERERERDRGERKIKRKT